MFFQNGKRVLGLALRHTKFQHKNRKEFFMTKHSAEAMSTGESGYERWRRFDLFQKSVNKINRVVLVAQEFSR